MRQTFSRRASSRWSRGTARLSRRSEKIRDFLTTAGSQSYLYIDRISGMALSRVTSATLDVLEALMGPDEELYGLRIAQNAGRKPGSVYPILARLEEAGWVESFWEREERGERGPRRRFYRLGPDGLAAARALLIERRGAIR